MFQYVCLASCASWALLPLNLDIVRSSVLLKSALVDAKIHNC